MEIIGHLGGSRGIFAKFFTKDGHFMELLELPKMPRGGHLLFSRASFALLGVGILVHFELGIFVSAKGIQQNALPCPTP